MRKPLRSITGLAAAGLLALAVVPSNAAPRAERELLGIRIWNKYSDVLSRFGQPTRIENGLVTSSGEGGQTVAGGAPGMGGMPGMPGGMGPRMGGMMGSGGPMGMGMGGRMGSGGPMGGMPGMPGGMMGSGGKMGAMMGGMGMPGMPGGMGMPGSGGPMGMGMPGMPGMGGAGGGAGTQGNTSDEATQTWIYQHGPITNFFVLNKDGRVVQIESSGLSGSGGVTAQGVRLGDPVAKVYRAYGWTGKVSKNGTAALLDYTRESHAAFIVQDKDGRGPVVVDIMVTLLDVGPPNPLGTGAGVAAGGGMGMGMPGMPGGMMGSGGRMGMGAMMGGKMSPGAMGMGMPGGMGGGRGKRGGGMGAAN